MGFLIDLFDDGYSGSIIQQGVALIFKQMLFIELDFSYSFSEFMFLETSYFLHSSRITTFFITLQDDPWGIRY